MEISAVFQVFAVVIYHLSYQCYGYYAYAHHHYSPYSLYPSPYGQMYSQGVAHNHHVKAPVAHVAAAPRYRHAASNSHKNANDLKNTRNIKAELQGKKKKKIETKPTQKIIEILNYDESVDAETTPDFLEGDIAIPEGKSRLAIDFDRFPAKKWKNNTVPYRISRNHTSSEVLMIESALRTISFVSCVRFEVWDGLKKDYVHFHPDKRRKGCWSYIGHQGGRQQLSLERPVGKDCNCFCSPGRAMHEIMHALGFYHEHARSDRDKYIQIVKQNVRKGKFANFFTKSDDETSRNFDYDYKSIMHYGAYFFSKNKRGKAATIIPKDPSATIGQRVMLSRMDCMKINSLYQCFDGDSEHIRKIQVICAMVGI